MTLDPSCTGQWYERVFIVSCLRSVVHLCYTSAYTKITNNKNRKTLSRVIAIRCWPDNGRISFMFALCGRINSHIMMWDNQPSSVRHNHHFTSAAMMRIRHSRNFLPHEDIRHGQLLLPRQTVHDWQAHWSFIRNERQKSVLYKIGAWAVVDFSSSAILIGFYDVGSISEISLWAKCKSSSFRDFLMNAFWKQSTESLIFILL